MRIQTLSILQETWDHFRSEGKIIGWTNGCFDLLHPGHLSTFSYLRSKSDVVIVGLNSDVSPYFTTKPGRPIHDEDFRVRMLLGLRDIDRVYVYSDTDPISSLLALRPNFCVKGGDYVAENMPEYSVIQSYWGVLEILPTLDHYSTTQSIQKILSTYK